MENLGLALVASTARMSREELEASVVELTNNVVRAEKKAVECKALAAYRKGVIAKLKSQIELHEQGRVRQSYLKQFQQDCSYYASLCRVRWCDLLSISLTLRLHSSQIFFLFSSSALRIPPDLTAAKM